MDPQTVNLVNVLNELWHMNHAQDVKMFASLFVFLISFATGTFIFYDFIRGAKRKLAGSKMHALLLSMSVFFYFLATFAFVRTMDGIQDMAYMLVHPSVATTLSQRSIILEIPFIFTGIANMVVLGIYAYMYYHLSYSKDRKNGKV